MGTVPAKPKPDSEPTAIESAVRSAIAGHPRAAVRRIVLWTVLFTMLVLGALLTDNSVASVAILASITVGALLALTDQLV